MANALILTRPQLGDFKVSLRRYVVRAFVGNFQFFLPLSVDPPINIGTVTQAYTARHDLRYLTIKTFIIALLFGLSVALIPLDSCRCDDEEDATKSEKHHSGKSVFHKDDSPVIPADLHITETIDESVRTLETQRCRVTWGKERTIRLACLLENKTGTKWEHISADGGCTCAKISVQEIQCVDNEYFQLLASFSPSPEPGLTRRTIQIRINDASIALPVLLEWLPVIRLVSVARESETEWKVEGVIGNEHKIELAESLTPDMKISSVQVTEGKFKVNLAAKVHSSAQGEILFRLAHRNIDDSTSKLEQTLRFELATTLPRVVPSVLVFRPNEEDGFVCSCRILFSRVGVDDRPRLARCELNSQSVSTIPLTFTVEQVSRLVANVTLSSSSLHEIAQAEEGSRVRFFFDHGLWVDCLFEVKRE